MTQQMVKCTSVGLVSLKFEYLKMTNPHETQTAGKEMREWFLVVKVVKYGVIEYIYRISSCVMLQL